MEAIEAVLDLAKERDEFANEIDTYESWFESLIGRQVTYSFKTKKKTRFVECEVTDFTRDGWELTSSESDEVFMITFEDLFNGSVNIHM